jgi:hypothetical protein
MRSTLIITMSNFLILALCSAPALADGGRVVLIERQGDCRISVFTSPDPLRAGPIDISVLIQDAQTGKPIPNAQIFVTLTSTSPPSQIIHAVATNDAATNKLLSAALVDLPAPGEWNIEINCLAQHATFQVHFTIDAGERTYARLDVWPWFTWPASAVILFGIHRRLVWRRRPVSG